MRLGIVKKYLQKAHFVGLRVRIRVRVSGRAEEELYLFITYRADNGGAFAFFL